MKQYYEELGVTHKTTYQRYIKLMIPHIPKGAKVLDVGCGDGAFLAYLKRKGYDPTGVDIAESAVKRAEKISGCPVFQAEADNLTMFEDETFDCLVSSEVLEHVFSPYNTLREFNRVLKDSGTLIITTPNSHFLARVVYPLRRTKFEIVSRHINCFDLTQWNVLFHLTGFELDWWDGFGKYAF
ncbi:MAG: class I SAM-dependent methyltransferase, partial [Candidatus Thorarchaeota archaeon]